MIVKKHKHGDRLILAVCDSDLIGKKITEGYKQLDLTSKFYKGIEKDKKKILELFKIAYIINLVGKKSVNLGVKAGIIEKNNISLVKKVPHAQSLLGK